MGSPARGPPEAVLAEGECCDPPPWQSRPFAPMDGGLATEAGDNTGHKAGQTQGPCCFSQGKGEGLRGTCKSLGLPSAQPGSSSGSGGGRGNLRAALSQRVGSSGRSEQLRVILASGHTQGLQTCWPSCRPGHHAALAGGTGALHASHRCKHIGGASGSGSCLTDSHCALVLAQRSHKSKCNCVKNVRLNLLVYEKRRFPIAIKGPSLWGVQNRGTIGKVIPLQTFCNLTLL